MGNTLRIVNGKLLCVQIHERGVQLNRVIHILGNAYDKGLTSCGCPL